MAYERKRLRRVLSGILALIFASALWLTQMHRFFRRDVDDFFATGTVSAEATALAKRHLALWSSPKHREREIASMRRSNAEWDFMARTYFVLALANMAEAEPAKRKPYLDVIDTIIDETIRLEQEHGLHYFLLPYATYGDFVAPQKRSIFQDGEIALMLAARCIVEKREDYLLQLRNRVDIMTATMKESPVLCAESYPNECWMFCNTIAVVAIRLSDLLNGTNHDTFVDQWLATVRKALTDKQTGMLITSFTFDGKHLDGPEGSSIWMVSHCLQLIDPEFAADQYARARRELGRSALGFGYSREWPSTWQGPPDIDSGPIIPVLNISAGSSGLAFIAAAAFDDRDYLARLVTSLEFGGFPERRHGTLRYHASNQVGDAVLLYAMVQGPLWKKAAKQQEEKRHD